MLLSAGLLGGIIAGVVAPRLLVWLGARRLVVGVFVAEAILIASASLATALPFYIAVAAALGCLGSLLWSAVLVALPALHIDETGVQRANRVVQTVRNLGYVVGPLLGSALFAWSAGVRGLLALAALMLLASIGVALTLPTLLNADVGRAEPDAKRRSADLRGLLRTTGMVRAIAPLIITVLVTSALNVLLIIRVRNDLDFTAATYGTTIAALSIGLVAGPLLFAGRVGKMGEATGASTAAAVIGVGIFAIGIATTAWELAAAAAVIGVANGVQNALMAGFIIQRVAPELRPFQMPAYVLILQSTVFAGFVCAAFIEVDAAGQALRVIGVIAAVVGVVGSVVNRSNKQLVIKEGATQ